MKKILFSMLFACFIMSCVTNKKYNLLQKDDVNKTNLPREKVVRTYDLDSVYQTIQTNDVLFISFESLTSKEFDFFGKSSQQSGNTASLALGASAIGDLVDDKGEIPFPVVGRVKVAGLTVFEAQKALQKIASKYLESPIVKVRLFNFRVHFVGEVKGTSVTLSNNRVNMLEAISLAGGFTDLADRSNVKLIRQNGNKSEIVYLNFLDENILKSPYFFVHQNDVLIVPPLRQRPFRNYFTSNLSLVLSSLSILLLVYTYAK